MKSRVLYLILFLFVICLGACSTESGESFENRLEVEQYFKQKGYVALGHFGDSWPAKIEEVVKSNNSLSFKTDTFGPQSYPGYDGYSLIAVKLRSSTGQENVLVFRSQKK